MADAQIAISEDEINHMIDDVVKAEGSVEVVSIRNANDKDVTLDFTEPEMQEADQDSPYEDETSLMNESADGEDPSELARNYQRLEMQYRTMKSAVQDVAEVFMQNENLAGCVTFRNIPASNFSLEQSVRVLKKVEDCISKFGIIRFHLQSIARTLTKSKAAKRRVVHAKKHITERLQELSEGTGLEDILSQLRVIFKETGVNPGPLFKRKTSDEDEDVKPAILDAQDDEELLDADTEMSRLVDLALSKMELDVDVEPPVTFRDDGTLDDSDMEINDFDDVENNEEDDDTSAAVPVNKGYSLRNSPRTPVVQTRKRGREARNINTDGFKDLPACIVCGKEFERPSQLTAHMRIHTGDKPFKCQLCDKTFRIAAALRQHEMIHTGEKPFMCKICGKTFRTISKCRYHEHSHDQLKTSASKIHHCTKCDKVFEKRFLLKIHMRIHNNERPFVCDVCSLALTTKVSLRSHKLNVHGLNLDGTPGEIKRKQNIECHICGKMIRKYGMKDHVSTHFQVKPHACDLCDQTFGQKTQLTYHVRKVHNNEKNFQCEDCGMWFVRRGVLKAHRNLKHPTEPVKLFECKTCGKKFNKKNNYMNHIPIHSGIKKYSCDQCDKSFFTVRDLKQHLKNYHDSGSLACEICGREMICKNTLKRHMLTHRKEKAHKCKECGSKFRREDTLKKHMALHTSVKYSCGKCGEMFDRKSRMVTHTNVCEAPYFVIEGDPSLVTTTAEEEASGILDDIQFVVTTDPQV